MGTLSQAKTYGGIGSILVLLSFIPTVGWVLAIAGFVLTLIAIKYISDVVQDSSIFNNALIAILIAIVGIALVGIAVVAYLFRFIGLRSLAGAAPGTVPRGAFGALTGIIAALVVVWILLVVSAYFLRKAYNAVSTKLNVGMFQTAALVYFIGAILTIILVGFLVLLIAQILLIVAFFSIPDTVGQPSFTPPPSPGSPTMATPPAAPTARTKYCVKCGMALAPDAQFCPVCGGSQPASM